MAFDGEIRDGRQTGADDEPDDDAKLLGVYSSGQAAEARILRARRLPGFRDASDGFQVSEYTVDEDGWNEGYTTL